MTKTVTLLNGTEVVLESGPEWGDTVCLICGTDYVGSGYGYCDESLECAFDEGEHLVKIG
jgi:hypothetical protein